MMKQFVGPLFPARISALRNLGVYVQQVRDQEGQYGTFYVVDDFGNAQQRTQLICTHGVYITPKEIH